MIARLVDHKRWREGPLPLSAVVSQINPARTLEDFMSPAIRYARTSDDVSIAYWINGDGPVLVQTPLVPFRHIEMATTFDAAEVGRVGTTRREGFDQTRRRRARRSI